MSDEDKHNALAKALRAKPDESNPRAQLVQRRRRIAQAVASRPIGEVPPRGLLDSGFVPKCPICNHHVWEIRGSERLEGFFEATTTGQVWNAALTEPTQLVLPTIAFVCERCGFIRQHAADKYSHVP